MSVSIQSTKNTVHQLSKSTFMRGIKCERSLFLNKHKSNLRDEISIEQQKIFDQGSKVGSLAQQLFPGGIDLTPNSFYDYGPSLFETRRAINRGKKVIYEAAFLYNGILAVMDILVKSKNGYKAYEVKSATEIKETHLQDVALQTYVIEKNGVRLEDISLVTINNQYEKNGKLDIKAFFNIESVKKSLKNYLDKIPAQVNQFKKVLNNKKEPNVNIGTQCHKPYKCDFIGHCWKNVPEYSVLDINNLSKEKRFMLFNSGVIHLNQVPANVEMGVNQQMQIEVENIGIPVIEKSQIKAFINELKYPLYFLDFETFSHAIPIFDKSRPYQHLVFQYSLHVQSKPFAKVDHYEHLAAVNGTDPRVDFIKQLISECGTEGDVVVYNMSFEKGKLRDLAKAFPTYEAPLNNIISRLKDLMVPFRNKWYYHPKMQGSSSLKKVFPAVVPKYEKAYPDLEINDGGKASTLFSKMIDGSFEGDLDQTRKDLLAYCELDTFSMVLILEKLYELVKIEEQ